MCYKAGNFLLQVGGQYGQALAMYQTAQDCALALHGPEHRDVAATHTNMGVVYGRQGDHANSQAQFQKARDIAMSVVGFNHPAVANGQINLAWINMKQGKENECKVHLGQALETGFLWKWKSFLESDKVFDPVRQTEWFQELLANAKPD